MCKAELDWFSWLLGPFRQSIPETGNGFLTSVE
jgi:hypothetical protein